MSFGPVQRRQADFQAPYLKPVSSDRAHAQYTVAEKRNHRDPARAQAGGSAAIPAVSVRPRLGCVATLFVFLIVASRNDIGTLQPAIQIDGFASSRAERIGITRRWPAALGAGPRGPKRRHGRFSTRGHPAQLTLALPRASAHARRNPRQP